MFFISQNKNYASNGGPVRYLDASSLSRPQNLPRNLYAIAGAVLLAAVIIGAFMLHGVLDGVLNASERDAQAVQENIARDVTYSLPILSDLILQDNATIKQSFVDAGFTIYDKTNTESNPDGLDLVKLPSDVSEVDAASYYAKGISKLSATEASRLFKGAWTFSVTRNDYTDMRVKYVDFSSGTIEAAIDDAIVSEGLSETTYTDSGTDDAGNTYQAGTIDIDGTTYTWRVSAIALSEVYDISGLPNTAIYVGVRMTP